MLVSSSESYPGHKVISAERMDLKVWTSAELEAMDPAEVDAIVKASVIPDPADAPAELLARTRDRIERRIAKTEPPGL